MRGRRFGGERLAGGRLGNLPPETALTPAVVPAVLRRADGRRDAVDGRRRVRPRRRRRRSLNGQVLEENARARRCLSFGGRRRRWCVERVAVLARFLAQQRLILALKWSDTIFCSRNLSELLIS